LASRSDERLAPMLLRLPMGLLWIERDRVPPPLSDALSMTQRTALPVISNPQGMALAAGSLGIHRSSVAGRHDCSRFDH
jgi:hypothetical protein